MQDIRKIVSRLDEVDIRILEIVAQEGGKVNLREIARRVKTNVSTCCRHVKKLEELGLLCCHTIGPSKVPILTALGLEVLRRISSGPTPSASPPSTTR